MKTSLSRPTSPACEVFQHQTIGQWDLPALGSIAQQHTFTSRITSTLMVSFSFAQRDTGYCFFNGSDLHARHTTIVDFINSTPSAADHVSSVSCSPSGNDWIICWDDQSNGGPTGAYHGHVIEFAAYPELAAQLADTRLNTTDPVTACSLGISPLHYLRRRNSMSWSLPPECTRDISIIETLGLKRYLLDIAFCRDGRAIYLFQNGFYLWSLDKTGMDSQLHDILQHKWSQGEHLEAAAIAPDHRAGRPARYFLHFGLTEFSYRVTPSILSEIEELCSSPPESNSQRQLSMQRTTGMTVRNVDFRLEQMRQQMIQHKQRTGEGSFNVAGIQYVLEVVSMIQQWFDGGQPQPRRGTGNLRDW